MIQKLCWSLLFVGFVAFSFGQGLIDKKATDETKNLYQNLKQITKLGFLFGHQDDDAYGVNWKGEEGRSDVKSVCGSFPAVHGWDVGKSLSNPANIDGVPFSDMKKWIKEIFERGGISTISMHLDNPVTNGDSWDKTSAVKEILPGGSKHHQLTTQLDLLVSFLNECKTLDGTKIPIILRPWHEHNGDWFWWGKGNCTEEEYIKLWQFTVTYLRDIKEVHQLIYAFSPDRGRMDSEATKESYLYGYPGDEYVDIIGLDNYMDVGVKWNKRTPEKQQTSFIRSLHTITHLAKEKDKVAALTETGLEGITNPNWFTEVILEPIKKHNLPIAYMLVWRNANQNHHYAPYPGHISSNDFIDFYADRHTLFESDIQNMYNENNPLLRE